LLPWFGADFELYILDHLLKQQETLLSSKTAHVQAMKAYGAAAVEIKSMLASEFSIAKKRQILYLVGSLMQLHPPPLLIPCPADKIARGHNFGVMS